MNVSWDLSIKSDYIIEKFKLSFIEETYSKTVKNPSVGSVPGSK